MRNDPVPFNALSRILSLRASIAPEATRGQTLVAVQLKVARVFPSAGGKKKENKANEACESADESV